MTATPATGTAPHPLITAAEGFPAIERLVAGAEREVLMSFRIFDPKTRLRTPELRERGLESWADLIGWVARKGVAVRLLMADFDPVFASDLHREAWTNASGFAGSATGDLQLLLAPHGQRAGAFWRLALRKKINKALAVFRDADPTRLTPIQRRILTEGPVLRPATLHQKFVVTDGSACVIGGLDVDERRFDTPDHDRKAQDTWHDISVAIEDSDFSGALALHFAECWNAAIAEAACLANPAEPRDTGRKPQARSDLRLLRTHSKPRLGPFRLGPKPETTEHEHVYTQLFSKAEKLIYIETQFFRHGPLADALVEAAARAPDLQLIFCLPAAPERVLFDGDDSMNARHAHGLQLKRLEQLKTAFGARLAIVSPAQPRAARTDEPGIDGGPPIYLHAKVTLVDDASAVVGSANHNGRSLRWDTEASALIRDNSIAGKLFDDLAAKWLGPRAEGRDTRKAETWASIAKGEAATAPEAREACLLPYPVARGQRFARRLPFLPDDLF